MDLFGNGDSPQRLGGRARAQKLSSRRKQDIARTAAQARWGTGESLVRAEFGSPDRPLVIGEIEIPCYVLEDGRRVIVQRGVLTALDMKQGTAGRGGGDRLAKFAATKGISPFVDNKLLGVITEPIKFRTGSSLAYGYEATVLADFCDAVLEARQAKTLHYQQNHIATRCEILVRAFARVGIIALVDEATGYQEIRDRRALEEILNKYISEELRKWTKTFPDEYFQQIFRLRGWDAPKLPTSRPGIIGTYTNDIVYARLAPGILDELQKLNPSDGKGRRKHKNFQFLSPEHGHPKLKDHLKDVVLLMTAAVSWREFKKLLDRAKPRVNVPGELPLNTEIEIKHDA